MSIYYPGCPDNIPNPSCSDCPSRELGDVRSLFFVKKSYSFADITDASEWYTAIAAGSIYVFPYTKGSMSQTATESAGYGDQETTLEGYEYVIDAMEPNYKDNWGFWDAIKNSKNWRVGYRTESLVHLADNVCQVTPTQPVTEDKKAAVVWNINVKFSQDDLLRPYDVPTGVFDICIDNA